MSLVRFNKIPKSASTYVTGVYSNLSKPFPMKIEDDDDHHIHIAIPSNPTPLTNNGLQRLLIRGNAKVQIGLNSK
jgi:hypothetical protein